MPRRGRKSAPDRLDPNLTPLLDVVLQLITFFMMLIHFGTRIEGANKNIRLPTAPAALPSSELALDRLTVAIDSAGRLLVEGNRAIEAGAAGPWWGDQAEKRREGERELGGPGDELPTMVVLRADKAVDFGVVRRTLIEAQGHGFAHFSLIVIRSRR